MFIFRASSIRTKGIVDKKVIEMQYSFLYKPEKNKNALSNYREIAGGGNSYPAIIFLGQVASEQNSHMSSSSFSLTAIGSLLYKLECNRIS